jgi:hypothetical protein
MFNHGAQAQVDIGATATTSAETDTATTSTSIDASASADISPISLTRDSVDSDAGNGVSGRGELKNAAMVATEEDLRAYARSVLEADVQLESTNLSQEAVTVVYKQPGRLLGIIPVSMTVAATVEQDGSVSLDYPWYGFMVAKSVASTDLETALENQIQTTLAANNITATTTGKLSARAQAEILHELQTSLSGGAAVSASGE